MKTLRPAAWCALVSAAILTIAGCANSPVRVGQSGDAAAPVSPGTGSVLVISPSPATQLAPSHFTVRLPRDPGPGARVEVSLSMPSMAMPETKITLHAVGTARYQGDGMFSMSGDWQASIAVTARGHKTVQVQSIHVR